MLLLDQTAAAVHAGEDVRVVIDITGVPVSAIPHTTARETRKVKTCHLIPVAMNYDNAPDILFQIFIQSLLSN